MRDPKNEIEVLALDLETDGVEEHVCNVIGIAFTPLETEGVYVPLREWVDDELKYVTCTKTGKRLEEWVDEILDTLSTKKLVLHNGVFDIACLFHSYSRDLTDSVYADTVLMKHTIDEERPFGLKSIGELYYGAGAVEEQQDLKENVLAKGGKWNKSNKDMYMADLDILAKYAIKDVILTLKLFFDFQDELEKQGLLEFFYDKEVMPLYKKATIPMKLNGLYVDQDYYINLKKEIENDIMKLTTEVFTILGEDIDEKVKEILDANVRTAKTGDFAQEVLRLHDIPVPISKRTGKPTLAKKELQSLKAYYPGDLALEYLTGNGELPEKTIYEAKRRVYEKRNPQLPYVFNLSSTHHLSWLLFEKYGEEPIKYSKRTGKPTVDKNALKHYAHLDFVKPLLELKKLEKMMSTYIDPILTIEYDGKIYPSMLQFGTTSGRYSCGGGLNLQTLPRDDLRVKRGFVAPKGYKIVAADFSSLEPRAFAYKSGDAGLKQVYWEDLDLYSKIAIDVLKLEGVSAREEDDNFLKKVNPEARHLVKTFALAVPYGAGAGRIANIMGKSFEEAMDIINAYLDAYPGLKDYMRNQEEQAYTTGMVSTDFGRIRHLPRAKELYDLFGNYLFNKKKLGNYMSTLKREGVDHEELDRPADEVYYEFRNLMNNSKNFPIQATAAHITNAAMIKLANSFKYDKLDAWICLQVHDEVVAIVREDQANRAVELMKDAMENNWVAQNIDVPMKADPTIANNLAEAK